MRLIRTVRPDVITAMSPTGTGGGQHHEASALIAREAFKLAGDPTKYPEQLKDGLRPWAPKKFYFNQGLGPPGSQPDAAKMLRVNLSVYDPLLGKTYAEIGTEARSMHKCQGMAQLLALPGPSASAYQLAESTIPGQAQKDETSLFDGVDSTIPGLVQFAGVRPPQDLVSGLATVASAVQDAQKKFDGGPHEATLPPLLSGLHAVRALRSQLRGMTLDENGRYDIDMRLAQKESEFQQAILLANAVHVEALADDGLVVPGQPVKVSVLVANNGASDVTVKQVAINGFDGDARCALSAVTAGGGETGRRPWRPRWGSERHRRRSFRR